MRARGPRLPAIAPGIYPDAFGYEVRARAVGQTKSKRFRRGTKPSTMTTWQEATRTALRAAARTARATIRRGTFAGDVAAHLATMTAAQRKAHVSLYNAWLTPELAGRARAGLTLEQLRTVISRWLEAGVAASSINHRRRALIGLYEALDGDDPPVLPRRLKRQREPAAAPQDVDMALLDAILARMRDYPYHGARRRRLSRPKAQLRFLLWTGMSPSTMARLHARDVDLARGEYRQPPRRKGRGAAGATVPLWRPQGLEAARAWLRASAWGPADKDRLLDALQRAVRSYREYWEDERRQPVSLPARITLRTLRHSFLTMVAREATDPRIVQLFGQHEDLATSRRYTMAAIADLARAVATGDRVPKAR